MTRFSTIFFCAVFALLSFSQPSFAGKLCKGKPRVALNDGSKACLLEVGLTKITSSQGVVGAGPAAKRKSEKEGGLVVLNFLGEASAEGLKRKTLEGRAKEVCQRCRAQILKKLKKPGYPFMAVALTWSDKPKPVRFGNAKQTYASYYFSKQCRRIKGRR